MRLHISCALLVIFAGCGTRGVVETRSPLELEIEQLRNGAGDGSSTKDFGEFLTDAVAVADGEFPGIGALVYNDDNGIVRIQCSAIELDSTRILTAAHCFSTTECFTGASTSYDKNKYRFVTGALARAREPSTAVLSWVIATKFSPADCTGDLAIAVLGAGAPHPPNLLSSANIVPPVQGEEIVKVGYGWSAEHDDSSGVLRPAGRREKARMKITKLSPSQPPKYFEYSSAAGRNSQICGGDSGGPAFRGSAGQYQLVGITSNGAGSAHCKTEPRDTTLTTYIDWIIANER